LQTRRITTAAALILLAGASGVSAQAPLRYTGMPAKVTYTTADSVASSMNMPTGSMVTSITSTSTLELELHPVGDSTHVVSKLKEMKGMMEAMGQSMEIPMPPTAMDPAEFMLAQNGRTRHLKGTGAPDIARGSTPSDAISRMFIRLPSTSLKIGDTWTDTIKESMDSANLKMSMTGLTKASYASDSTVDGIKVKVLRFTSDMEMNMAGNVNGMDMTQKVKGSSKSMALFDPARNIVIYIRDDTKMEGTLDAPSAGMTSVPISQDIRRTLRLKP